MEGSLGARAARISGRAVIGRGSHIGADDEGNSLAMNSSVVDDNLRIGGSTRFAGKVDLGDMTVNGSLAVESGTCFGDGDQGDGLTIDGLRVRGDIGFDIGCLVNGSIRGRSVQVDGEVSLNELAVIGSNSSSVMLEGLAVGGAFEMFDCTVRGDINLSRVNIGGEVVIARLNSATGVGSTSLDLSNASLGLSLTVFECNLMGGISLVRARVASSLGITSSYVGRSRANESIEADGLVVDGNVHLRDVRLSGGVWTPSVSIGGEFRIRTCRVGLGPQQTSVNLEESVIGSDVILADSVVVGAVSMQSASFSDDFSLWDCKVFSPHPLGAVLGKGCRVSNDLRIGEGVKLNGAVNLDHSFVGGAIVLDGAEVGLSSSDDAAVSISLVSAEFGDLRVAKLSSQGGVCVRAARVKNAVLIESVSRLNVCASPVLLDAERLDTPVLVLEDAEGSGPVTLCRAQIGLLDDASFDWLRRPRVSWNLDGLVVGRLPALTPDGARERAEWLSTSGPDREQAADRGTFRSVANAVGQVGSDQQSRIVLKRMGEEHNPPLWRIVLSPVSQGYEPQRALLLLIVLFLAMAGLVSIAASSGWLVASSDVVSATGQVDELPRSDECNAEAYVCLKTFPYTADLILPIVSSGDTEYWVPDTSITTAGPDLLAMVFVGARIAGWVLGGLLVFGVVNTYLEQRG